MTELQDPAGGSPAGKPSLKRACTTCARLKMKCQWPESATTDINASCRRCNRMKIDCSVPTPHVRRKRGKGTRVAQLEEKIDGLVSLLHAGQHVQAQAQSTLTPDSLPSSHTYRQPSPFQASLEPATQDPVPPVTQDPVPPITLPLIFDHGVTAYELLPEFKLSSARAQEYLNVFRQAYMPNFPFVAFDSHLTADVVYARDSCLFWAVMGTVAPLTPELQTAVKSAIRGQISDRVVVKREKSLYLLQAILIYLAWSEWHLFFESQATPLMQLAQSLATDLKLDKSVKSTTLAPRTLLGDAWESFKHPNSETRQDPSAAEKRALLGTYHLCSLVTALFRRGPRPTWTSHHSQCCDDLYRNGDASDTVCAAQMTLQRILDRALTAMPTYLGNDAVFSGPLEMYLSNTARELADVMARLPDFLQSSSQLQMLYYIYLLRLYEPVVAMHPQTHTQISATPRTDTLFKTLQHAKSFFEIHHSLSPSDLNFLPNTALSMHGFANYSISRLLICDATTDWDPVIARREIDFYSILIKSSEQLDQADRAAQEQGWKRRGFNDTSTVAFEKFASKMRWISGWYLKSIGSEESSREAEMVQADGPVLEGELADGPFGTAFVDLMAFQDAGLFENFNFDAF